MIVVAGESLIDLIVDQEGRVEAVPGGGTRGLVLEPRATTIEALGAATPPELLVMIDPNCRATAISDPAAYRARLDRILGRVDVVKVSVDALAFLDPAAEPLDAARR